MTHRTIVITGGSLAGDPGLARELWDRTLAKVT